MQYHLGGDDDENTVVSLVRIGEDFFEVDDSKNGGDDDSEIVLASRTIPHGCHEERSQESA